MYTKPIAYKIYSIIMLVVSLTSAAYSLIGNSVISKSLYQYTGLTSFGSVTTVVWVCISVFIAYMEFTSMFTFAQMIKHEESGSPAPFIPMGIVLPPRFYKVFGTVMYVLLSVLQIVGVVLVGVSCALARLPFWPSFWATTGTLLAGAAFNALCYLQYFCKYRTFGDLLAVKTSQKVPDVTVRSLGKDNPNHLRGFCVFLYGFGIFCIAASIVSILFVGVAGVFLTIAAFLLFIPLSVIGCYFDNLAKMLEHYLIQYKLI